MRNKVNGLRFGAAVLMACVCSSMALAAQPASGSTGTRAESLGAALQRGGLAQTGTAGPGASWRRAPQVSAGMATQVAHADSRAVRGGSQKRSVGMVAGSDVTVAVTFVTQPPSALLRAGQHSSGVAGGRPPWSRTPVLVSGATAPSVVIGRADPRLLRAGAPRQSMEVAVAAAAN